MTTEYYTHSGYPNYREPGTSADAQAEFNAVENGFAKFPAMSTNAGKLLAVNTVGTAIEGVARDLVFSTTAERTAYLTSPLRYPGMLVSDLEDEHLYMLNAAGDTWVRVDGSGGGISGLTDTEVVYGAPDGSATQDSAFTYVHDFGQATLSVYAPAQSSQVTAKAALFAVASLEALDNGVDPERGKLSLSGGTGSATIQVDSSNCQLHIDQATNIAFHLDGSQTAGSMVLTHTASSPPLASSMQFSVNDYDLLNGNNASVSFYVTSRNAVDPGSGDYLSSASFYIISSDVTGGGSIGMGADSSGCRIQGGGASMLIESSTALRLRGGSGIAIDSGTGFITLSSASFTGSSTATFSANNAPAVISPKLWIKVVIGTTVGYIPWFST